MSRLRRQKCDSFPAILAAEVLEARSLLSAGATAVHQATHAADQAVARSPDPHVQAALEVTVQLSEPGFFQQLPGGALTITPVVLKQGAHVTIHVTAVDNSGVSPVTYTANIKGKITSWHDVGISTQVSLIPTGTVTGKTASGQTIGTAKAQKGEPLTLTLKQNTLEFITLDVNFVTHAKPPVTIDFQASVT